MGGENILSHFLKYIVGSDNPIDALLPNIVSKYKTCFIYGDSDWMDVDNAKSVIENLPKENNLCEPIIYVENSSHQFNLENPEEFCKELLNIAEKWVKEYDPLDSLIPVDNLNL